MLLYLFRYVTDCKYSGSHQVAYLIAYRRYEDDDSTVQHAIRKTSVQIATLFALPYMGLSESEHLEQDLIKGSQIRRRISTS